MDDTEKVEPEALNALSSPFSVINDEEEKKIQDPWHSRVLDVHRWSEHPEIVAIVDTVWSEVVRQNWTVC